jgi:APA family basic amino acid/polyamine antiporter
VTTGDPADTAAPDPTRGAPVRLRRRLSLPLLVLYGMGTTIGAGIYVLIGKTAAKAGLFAPFSFLLACLIAGLTAFSFAELSARYPQSAGEAVYVSKGFRSRHAAFATGMLVVLAGIVSSGSIVNGFVGYFREFVDVQPWLIIAALTALLGLIAAWGIAESVLVAGVMTLVEIGGLVAVVWGGREALGTAPARVGALLPPFDLAVWTGIVSGTVLAFYAFLGFEDMVNVAEEVKTPRKTLPRGILLTLVLTLILYVLLALVAVLAIPVGELSRSSAPLADIFERTTGASSTVISLIAMVAVVNGALIQVIMASRVLYGLAGQGWLPAGLGRVGRRTHTPLVATAVVTLSILAFALFLPLTTLAEGAALVTLIIFAMVNAALLLVRRRDREPPRGFRAPIWAPVCGILVCAGMAVFQIVEFGVEIGRLAAP